jgi:hypothetical protein
MQLLFSLSFVWYFQTSQVLFGSGLTGMCPSVVKNPLPTIYAFFKTLLEKKAAKGGNIE